MSEPLAVFLTNDPATETRLVQTISLAALGLMAGLLEQALRDCGDDAHADDAELIRAGLMDLCTYPKRSFES